MSDHLIQITAVSGNTLTLNPSGTVNVDPGDTVTWEAIAPEITEITGISLFNDREDHNGNIFPANQPKPVKENGEDNLKKWQGRVISKADLHDTDHEEYTISWRDSDGDHDFDPRLQVNPKSSDE